MTPLMKQYWDIKSAHTDKVLLFRMGDFFEMFHEDAVTAAPILNIALTSRNKKAADDTPMCGVPHHSIAGPIAKLLAAGHKVAICDQVEDPKQAKGIVKRAVTRILSPGMVYDPETLEQTRANYLCSFDSETVSFLETSTGEAFFYMVESAKDAEHLKKLLMPAELVLTTEQKEQAVAKSSIDGPFVSVCDEIQITSHVEQSLPVSAQRLLSYAVSMQGKEILNSISEFELRSLEKRMIVSSTVAKHLELFETYKGDKKGSLFQAINKTKSSVGSRLLKQWICFPLTDRSHIERRQDQVQGWYDHPSELKKVRAILAQLGDVERRLVKISNPTCHPQDLIALKQSLIAGLSAGQLSAQISLGRKADDVLVETAEKLIQAIDTTIDEDTPLHFKVGGVISKGFSKELDELIELAENGQKLLLEMEQSEKQKTGIPSLKIRYNNVFGYYIEVTKLHTSKVPDHYKRKQTLTNAERYLTQELQELEDKILSSRAKRVDLEKQIFDELKQTVLQQTSRLLALSRFWSEIDALSSLAWLAMEHNFSRPQFNENNEVILKKSRHPVVEQEMKQPFIANTLQLKRGDALLLTGPNMAGKSTLMRQVAVNVILAQIGSFVACEKADLPLFHQLFTRIGASDSLAEGLSTFMVEMTESAEMLKSADEKSLVILDEVGRGTSTYDGMSLAQSILEYLLSDCGATTLFATHYHELTSLDKRFSNLHNAHMSIDESKKGQINFLYTLVNGPANKSYGIHVAKLAGLPDSVTLRANQLLSELEANPKKATSAIQEPPQQQMSLLDPVVDPELEQIKEEIGTLSVHEMTPLEALNKISQWQKNLN